jgi:HTH-type transcriptional regulator / antitoxin HigA
MSVIMPLEIKSHIEYESALARINELWEVAPNTREGAEYDALFEAVEKYEAEHYPMDEPDSYAAVEYHLDRLNLSIDVLPISDYEKAILKDCISKNLLVPEWLLAKLSSALAISRELLGRADTSQETSYAHNRMK